MNHVSDDLDGFDALLSGGNIEFSNLSNNAHCCITTGAAKACINIISKVIMGLGVALSGVAYAQQATTGTPIHSDGNSTELSFGGLAWRIPTRFFRGISDLTNDSKDLWIQFRWEHKNDSFSSVDINGDEMELDIHIRNVDIENPKNALTLIHRIRLPFAKVPVFAAAKFNGMTYLGSSSSFHYFSLDNETAYVSCWLIKADRLMPPTVAPDVLSKQFTCNTMFHLPHNTYAWVKNWGVDLNDTAPAFVAAHRQILSYIR